LGPKPALISGSILLLAGALLQIVLPDIGFSLVTQSAERVTGVDQAILLLVDTITRSVGVLVTPLGTALFGAGLVMAFIERRSPG
jgi:hypothetical protein